MVKLYTCNLTYRHLFILGFLTLWNGVLGQIRVDGTFNQTDRGFGFGDGPNAPVQVVKSLPDGKVLIAGSFTQYSGTPRKGIARLKGSNGLDSTFQPGIGFDGGIPLDLAIQSDGKILVVGSFTSFNGLPANRIVRLNPNGSRDLTFGLGGTGPSGGAVTSVKWMPNGQIFVAGNFSTFNGFSYGAVVRLQSNGNLDLSFNPGGGGTTGTVEALEVQADGKVLVGGFFNNNINGITATGLVRLLGNGSVDPAFAIPVFDNTVFDIALHPSNGSMYVGGSFSAVNQLDGRRLVRLLADGAPDVTFQVGFSFQIRPVYKVDLIGEKVLAVGAFTHTIFRSERIALFFPDGSQDFSFAGDTSQGANSDILSVDIEGSGTILIAGKFTRFDRKGRNYVARINAEGNVVEPFSENSGADRAVYSLAIQPDQKILLGGEFGYYNSNSFNSLTRILPNGQIDFSFVYGDGFNGVVRSVLIQPDGKILVGGCFTLFNNETANSLVRLNPNGTRDFSFLPLSGTADTVFALALQSDGKVLVGGNFSTFHDQAAPGIARLNINGTRDNSFSPGSGFNGPVRAISILKDSLILVGGSFSQVQGNNRNGIAALTMAGGYLSQHNMGAGISTGGTVYALAIQPDRKVLIGGKFASYNGQVSQNVARLLAGGSPDSDFAPGELINGTVFGLLYDPIRSAITVGGSFTLSESGGRQGLVRLSSNGRFLRRQGNGLGSTNPIFALDADEMGNLLIAGDFTHFDSIGRNRVARLENRTQDTTTWSGTDWSLGEPDSTFSALIAGNYTGPGFSCQNLRIQPGRLFFPGSVVRVHGNISQNSQQYSGLIELVGSVGQTIQGFFQDLTLNNSAGYSLSGPTSIRGTLLVKSNNLVTNNQLTFLSSSGLTARLGPLGSGASISGNATVQRFVPGGQTGWYFLGVPVANQNVSDWSDDFPVFPNSLFLHNESGSVNAQDQANGWVVASGPLVSGKGYRTFLSTSFFNGTPIIDNTGPLITGDFSFPLSFTAGGYGGGGWNFLSNPYACEVDWHGFAKNQVESQVHFWNKTQYGSYSQGIGIGVNGGGRYIPSFQGFFVRSSSLSASLQISESTKPEVPQNPSFLRVSTEDPTGVGRFVMRGGPLGISDETAIRWMPTASDDFEGALDADKLMNPDLSFFSLTNDGRPTSIQARLFEVTDDVDFGYSVSQPGSYFLEIHLSPDVFAGKTWYLKDNESGFIYTLETPDFQYPFQVSPGLEFSNYRFTLSGTTVTRVADLTGQGDAIRVFPNPAKEKLFVVSHEPDFDFEIFDASGKSRKKGRFSRDYATNGIELTGLPSGVYQFRYHLGSKLGNQKLLVLP